MFEPYIHIIIIIIIINIHRCFSWGMLDMF